MSAYLDFGLDEDEALVAVASVSSGKTDLRCPFCRSPLIAVKGSVRDSHFRHHGKPCRESGEQLPVIQGFDRFDLQVPQQLLVALRKGYPPSTKGRAFSVYGLEGEDCQGLQSLGLIEGSIWSQFELTDKGAVVLGALSLNKFDAWFRQFSMAQAVSQSERAVALGDLHPMALEILRSRLWRLLNARLYLFELTTSAGVLHKLGRTRRSARERLSEVVADVERAGMEVTVAKVVKDLPNRGYLEQFALHKTAEWQEAIGSHTEYRRFEGRALATLKSDFTRLKPEPFSKLEHALKAGRWRYEARRIAAVKEGIKRTLEQGGRFGRPKGTSTSPEQMLIKHRDVVACLDRGYSINKTAEFTNKGRATVTRVRKVWRDLTANKAGV